MRVNDDYAHHNAKQQLSDPNSVHAYWKQVLRVRKEYGDTIIYGDFRLLDHKHDAVFSYQRTGCQGVATVVTNFTEKQQIWETPEGFPVSWSMNDVVLANYPKPAAFEPGKILLRPFVGLVFFERN
jgi:glycosidase